MSGVQRADANEMRAARRDAAEERSSCPSHAPATSGPLIDDDALLACLDAEHLGHATLDVFDIEPLPAEHVFWHHPKITVTPHIASGTRPDSASKVIAENIRRGEAGEALLHLVDRHTGY